MDHIEQLKKIRAEAIARMRNSPDFKLAGKLGLLIVELGETIDDHADLDDLDVEPASAAAEPAVTDFKRPFESTYSKPKDDDFVDIASDDMIDELVAEIEEDAAELDAIMAEQDKETSKTVIGPFLKTESTLPRYSNGSAH